MRVGLTGTPGTGKTTAVEQVDGDLEIVHLNDVIRDHGLYCEVDEKRDSLVADLEAVRNYLEEKTNVLIESHLAHYVDTDITILLRCRPDILEQRLLDRGTSPEKAKENAESEALDVILLETLQRQDEDSIFEIETTHDTPTETANKIQSVLDGERSPSFGTVDYTEYL